MDKRYPKKTHRDRYNEWTGQQDIHCNRFPSWDELSNKQRSDWIKAHPAKGK